MRKSVKIIYVANLVFVLLLLMLFYTKEKNDEYIARSEAECKVWSDYDMTSYANPSAPAGITREYKWILQDVPMRDGAIAFYVAHQEAEIYLDDVLVYKLAANTGNRFSKTTGYNWSKAFLYPEDEGKEIRILINPIYKTGTQNDLLLYYGSYDTICSTIFLDSLFLIVLGFMFILFGFSFLVFVLINIKNHELDRSIVALGIFSIFAGLWKLTDMPCAPLLFPDGILLSAIALTSIPMMLLPFFFFLRTQFAKKRHKFWDSLCIVCSLVSILTIILQIAGIADLRQTLPLSHVMLIVCVVCVVAVFCLEIRNMEFTLNLRITLACCLLCLFGSGIDMIMYYYSGRSGSMILGMLAFLIYIVLVGYLSLRNALRLVEQGREAKKYEQLAMHDELTGLHNRAFYAQYLRLHNLQQNDSYIIMFDVNNLKQCNDTIGHDGGDRLLKNSAFLLSQEFDKHGECMRIGGDEFCVILPHTTENDCIAYLKQFNERLVDYNEHHPEEFPIMIAYGYAHYNRKEDFDFRDTVRRADKKMYQMKIAMKTHRQ